MSPRMPSRVFSTKCALTSAKCLMVDKMRGINDMRTAKSEVVRAKIGRLAFQFGAPPAFDHLELVQQIDHSQGAVIRTAKFSHCGQLFATGGSDGNVSVYCSVKVCNHFVHIRANVKNNHEAALSSCASRVDDDRGDGLMLFMMFTGHCSDVIDIVWSEFNFLLTASLDKTVKLWHIAYLDCLCTFKHTDYVSSVNFLPVDPQYFVSTCFDGFVRVWNIADKRIQFCRDVTRDRDNRITACQRNIITCSAFMNHGKFLVLGTTDGRLLFYFTDKLIFLTQCHISSCITPPRVISVESIGRDERKILVTCNDSLIRMYKSCDWSLKTVQEYKGATIRGATNAIRASLSPDHKFIVSGSECNAFFIWKSDTKEGPGHKLVSKFIKQYERVHLAHPQVSTVCCFASPNKSHDKQSKKKQVKPVLALFAPQAQMIHSTASHVLLSIDQKGRICIFSKRVNPSNDPN